MDNSIPVKVKCRLRIAEEYIFLQPTESGWRSNGCDNYNGSSACLECARSIETEANQIDLQG